MRNPPPEIEKDKIRRLIAAETDPALAKFRKIDFEANVRKRIGEIPARKSGISFGRILPIPVWVAIAAVLLVAGIVVVSVFQKTPRPNMAQTIEAVLGKTDGFLARRYDVIERSQPDGDVGLAAGDNFLAAALRNASSAQNHAPQSPAPAKTPRVRPLRLEEIYKILFIDKAIEHVLTLISS
jgi:hypothetical protein